MKKLFAGYNFKFSRGKSESYYFEFNPLEKMMGMGGNIYHLGGIFKLDNDSAVATSLKFIEGKTVVAKFGYKRRVKNYQV